MLAQGNHTFQGIGPIIVVRSADYPASKPKGTYQPSPNIDQKKNAYKFKEVLYGHIETKVNSEHEKKLDSYKKQHDEQHEKKIQELNRRFEALNKQHSMEIEMLKLELKKQVQMREKKIKNLETSNNTLSQEKEQLEIYVKELENEIGSSNSLTILDNIISFVESQGGPDSGETEISGHSDHS